jgi:hypothetical protein
MNGRRDLPFVDARPYINHQPGALSPGTKDL